MLYLSYVIALNTTNKTGISSMKTTGVGIYLPLLFVVLTAIT
jgi:hypothetical protein